MRRAPGAPRKPMTFNEIAKELNVSRPRAEQIFRSAMRKIRRSRAFNALIGAATSIDSPGPAVFGPSEAADTGNKWIRAKAGLK